MSEIVVSRRKVRQIVFGPLTAFQRTPEFRMTVINKLILDWKYTHSLVIMVHTGEMLALPFVV